MTQPTVIKLEVEAATAEALEPFGDIVGRQAPVTPIAVDFYKGAVRMSYPTKFTSEHPVEMSLAQMTRRPGEVRYMERHFQHTQAFIPLGGKPFVVVMAPPGEGDLPDLDKVRAFHFDGSAGFAMKVGTWHEFPFAIEDDTDVIVVLSSQTGYDLKAKDAETEEAHGPDLDKKDMVARTGNVLSFDLGQL